ncbi:MAG: hypothetical protein ACRC1W_12210 [Shewanella sp.]
MAVIRVPNLPTGFMTEADGSPTDDEMVFRQNLISSLQQNFGNEGLVAPSQSAANIAIIAANQNENSQYTTQAGTMIYNTDTDALMVAILVAGVPTFKTVTVV